MRLYDRLFAVPHPGAGGRDFLQDLNPDVEEDHHRASSSRRCAERRPEERFQFERHGYFVADRRTTRRAARCSTAPSRCATRGRSKPDEANFSNDLYLASPNGFYSTNIIFNNHASPIGSIVDLGFFTAGTELKFRLHVNNTGNDWFTGPGSRNADGLPHARITNQWSPTESLVEFEDLAGPPEGNAGFNDLAFSFTNTIATVPKPGTYAMFAAGIVLLVGLQRSRRVL